MTNDELAAIEHTANVHGMILRTTALDLIAEMRRLQYKLTDNARAFDALVGANERLRAERGEADAEVRRLQAENEALLERVGVFKQGC